MEEQVQQKLVRSADGKVQRASDKSRQLVFESRHGGKKIDHNDHQNDSHRVYRVSQAPDKTTGHSADPDVKISEDHEQQCGNPGYGRLFEVRFETDPKLLKGIYLSVSPQGL